MYGSWSMECDRQNFLSFWTIFCTFTPRKTWKIKILKKWKKLLEIFIILHKYTKNHYHVLYCSWDMARGRCNYFSFWAIFCPFTAQNSPKNQNFKKMKKTSGDIIILHVYQKLWLDDLWFLRYAVWQTDRQKKWHIEVGAPPKEGIICIWVFSYFSNLKLNFLLCLHKVNWIVMEIQHILHIAILVFLHSLDGKMSLIFYIIFFSSKSWRKVLMGVCDFLTIFNKC